jgi:hypothetical protein
VKDTDGVKGRLAPQPHAHNRKGINIALISSKSVSPTA